VIFVAFWRLNYTQMLSCITRRIGVLNHTAFFYFYFYFYFKQELCFVAYYDIKKTLIIKKTFKCDFILS
jgi:hypothetical protein